MCHLHLINKADFALEKQKKPSAKKKAEAAELEFIVPCAVECIQ